MRVLPLARCYRVAQVEFPGRNILIVVTLYARGRCDVSSALSLN